MNSKKKGRARRHLPCGRPFPIEVSSREALKPLEDRWARFTSEKGLKSSAPRTKISRLILEQPGHFSVQDISKLVHQKFPEIGSATVYRMINLLVESGVVKETLVDSSGATIFEVAATGHHDHLVCLDCGAIFEFHEPELEAVQTKAITKLKFSEVRHRHVVYARCDLIRRSVSL